LLAALTANSLAHRALRKKERRKNLKQLVAQGLLEISAPCAKLSDIEFSGSETCCKVIV
jgi:hypothetical protein